MYITIFLLSLVLFNENSAIEEREPSEFFRLERIQAQCNAWCYQNYGNWTTIKNDWGEGYSLFDCVNGNYPCFNCSRGCSREFYNLAECYRPCNGNEVCKKACQFHKQLYRKEVNVTQQKWDMDNVAFPNEIYENPSGRTEDAIQLEWHQTEHYFKEKTAVTFLVILYNRTSYEELTDAENRGLPIGNTPNYTFTISALSHKFCYHIRMISVTQDKLIGSATNLKLFSVDPVIHVVDMTTTTAHIWFEVPWCLKTKEFSINVLQSDEIKTKYQNVTQLRNTSETVFEADVSGLHPNQKYYILVERKRDPQEYFSWHEQFTTLPDAPSTNVTVKAVTDITESSITYHYEIRDTDELWGLDPLYFLLRVGEQGNDLSIKGEYVEYKIPREFDAIAPKKTIPDLEPFTTYCMSMTVVNQYGAGPWSTPLCKSTQSTSASPPEAVLAANVTSTTMVLNLTRPERENGVLDYYLLEYYENGATKRKQVNITEGEITEATLDDLNPYTFYNISISAVSAEGNVGETTWFSNRTQMDKPARAPLISSCIVSSNKTHVNVSITWVDVPARFQHGPVDHYTVFVQQQENSEEEEEEAWTVITAETFTDPGTDKIIVASTTSISLSYSDREQIVAQISVATPVGSGPYSRVPRICEIDPILSTNIVAILIPIFCVISILFLALLAFFYFFRFKTYKKTPYEEIKKLVKPEAFSPCQHCTHNKEPKKWDVFICHVSEDLEYICKLKEAFVREKIDVFFAKDELSWGCSLHRVINDGLINSKYGLVVLSKHFFGKCNKWTSNELSNLHTKSRLYSEDLILPVWKNDITKLDVGEFDMTLLGIKGLKEADMTVEEMAIELKKKLKDETCWGCRNKNCLDKSTSDKTDHIEEEKEELMTSYRDTESSCV